MDEEKELSSLSRMLPSWIGCFACRSSGVKKVVGAAAKFRHRKQRKLQGAAGASATEVVPSRPVAKKAPCKKCNGLGILPHKHSSESPQSFEPINSPHVIIVGGGIAGCALALALQHRNIPCKVYEKDASFNARSQGYALTMQQAATTLRKLGFQDLKQYGSAPSGNSSFLPDGSLIGCYGRKTRGSAGSTAVGSRKSNKSPREHGSTRRFNIQLPRQRLRQMFHSALLPGTVQWGCCFKSVTLLPPDQPGGGPSEAAAGAGSKTKVRATFERQALALEGGGQASNSSSVLCVEGDLLVGADGIWSAVRQKKFELLLAGSSFCDEPSAPVPATASPAAKACPVPPQYLGVIVILGRAAVEHPLCEAQDVFQTVDGQTRIYCMPFDQGSTMWQLSFPISEQGAKELSRKGGRAMLAEAVRRCGGWHAPVPALLRNTNPAHVTGYPAYDRPPPGPHTLRPTPPTPHPGCNTGRRAQGGEQGRQPKGVAAPQEGAEGVEGVEGSVLLLGDAWHPMSPFKGQGANQAVIDAWELAVALASIPSAQQPEHTPSSRQSGGQRGGSPEGGGPLAQFRLQMDARVRAKVLLSAAAAQQLHSPAALAQGDRSRASAARESATIPAAPNALEGTGTGTGTGTGAQGWNEAASAQTEAGLRNSSSSGSGKRRAVRE